MVPIPLLIPNVEVTVSAYPAAPGALHIQTEDPLALHAVMVRQAALWHADGISSYLLYAKQTSKGINAWELIPFSSSIFPFFQQMRIFYHVCWGTSPLSLEEQEAIADHYSLEPTSPAPAGVPLDTPLSREKRREAQEVLVGTEADVWYNCKPIGPSQAHFLVISKEKVQGADQLTPQTYVEVAALTHIVAQKMFQEGFSELYILEKKGVEAGQSVPHFHRHLIFLRPDEVASAQWSFFFQMLGSPLWGSPLFDEQLHKNVTHYRHVFTS